METSCLSHLTTEYKVNPLGMDEPSPRFSWRAEGTGTAQQTARRILVRDEAGHDVWDSGFVAAGDSVLIPYGGEALRPFTRYSWRAEARFNDNTTVVSNENAFFETGFLGRPWANSKWITAGAGQGERRPAMRLARELTIAKPLRRARLYATALGLYVPFVNGKRVTDNRLAPGWTQYDKRVQYQAYDITPLLHSGDNALAALLGDGWYCGTISRISSTPGSCGWGWTPQFRAELRLEYDDGSVETIGTDTTWSSFYLNPAVLENDIYHGEEYDATVDDEAWKLPGFQTRTSSVSSVREGGTDAGEIVWNSGAEVRVVRELRPVTRTRRPSGVWQLDFGENVAGVERLTLKTAHPGAIIGVRHGEALDADGDLWCANLAFAKQRTLVTCGKKPFSYTPNFTFYGFRYLEVSGWPEEMDDDSVIVEVLSSAVRRTGSFASSNPLLDRFFENAARSQQDNFVDVPTDCPQRCERCGWTGDAQVFSETALMNFDCGAFFTKWIADLYAARSDAGAFGAIAPFPPNPTGGEKPWGILGWSDAGVVCPWMLYRKCGDRRILETCFDGAARYVRNQDEAGDQVHALGDHLSIGANTPSDFLGQILRIENMRLVAAMAHVLGRADEERHFTDRRAERLAEFQRRHFSTEGEIDVRTQTAAACVLVYNLAPNDEARRRATELLADDIRARNIHLSTGFLGTPILLKALEEAGDLPLAYQLLEQTSCPSWLYPVTQGATTTWERWDAIRDGVFHESWMNSLNHYAFGSAAAWLYSSICGIRDIAGEDPAAAGWKRFRLAPHPGGSLTFAEASFDSPYGEIRSRWERSTNGIAYTFAVPANTTAELRLPGEPALTLHSGTHRVVR